MASPGCDDDVLPVLSVIPPIPCDDERNETAAERPSGPWQTSLLGIDEEGKRDGIPSHGKKREL
jgi:hypothetical protein